MCDRIRELGASERKLLVRVEDLMEQAAAPSALLSRQRQEERLRMLREDVQSLVRSLPSKTAANPQALSVAAYRAVLRCRPWVCKSEVCH